MFRLFRRSNLRARLLKSMPHHAVCAEIGVWKGNFSAEILAITEPRELHLVDPWRFSDQFPMRWYGGAGAKSQADMDTIHNDVVARFKDRPTVVLHRQLSVEASADFPNGFFDWIYIDGDHSYEAVLDDLRAWTPKVKKNGFVAGDDYGWHDEAGRLSVKQAADEFIAEFKPSKVSTRDGQFYFRV